MSPGRKPRLSPASTAGRASTMRRTRFRVSASTAAATARYVLPVPAGPMPTVMSLSWICFMYSACPGVFAWMTLRIPGSAIRGPPSLPVAPSSSSSPSPPRSMASPIRSTSSGVRSRRCFAASIMRCAIAAARSTKSLGPVIVIVSPRNVMRTPPRRDSSTRLPSLTPASVNGSAPSVDSFCATDSSAIDVCGLDNLRRPDVEVLEVLRRNFSGRALEQRARGGGLWERDHVTQRACVGELHRDAIEAERDAAVRRRAGAEPLEQESEPRLRGCFIDAEQREDPRLDVRVADADAAATQLRAVEDAVVGLSAGLLRRALE